jgi:hypothetical protein
MESTPRLSRLTRLQHTGRRQKILIFNIGGMSSTHSWNATSGWTGADGGTIGAEDETRRTLFGTEVGTKVAM